MSPSQQETFAEYDPAYHWSLDQLVANDWQVRDAFMQEYAH